MRSSLLAGAIFIATGIQARQFHIADLPGDDYIPYPNITVIDSNTGDYDSFDANSWAHFVLTKCGENPSCEAVASFSRVGDGNRSWVGYLIGIPIDTEDFRKAPTEDEVEGSRAFSADEGE